MEYFRPVQDLRILYYDFDDSLWHEVFLPKGSLWSMGDFVRYLSGISPRSIDGLEVVHIRKKETYRVAGIRFACKN